MTLTMRSINKIGICNFRLSFTSVKFISTVAISCIVHVGNKYLDFLASVLEVKACIKLFCLLIVILCAIINNGNISIITSFLTSSFKRQLFSSLGVNPFTFSCYFINSLVVNTTRPFENQHCKYY